MAAAKAFPVKGTSVEMERQIECLSAMLSPAIDMAMALENNIMNHFVQMSMDKMRATRAIIAECKAHEALQDATASVNKLGPENNPLGQASSVVASSMEIDAEAKVPEDKVGQVAVFFRDLLCADRVAGSLETWMFCLRTMSRGPAGDLEALQALFACLKGLICEPTKQLNMLSTLVAKIASIEQTAAGQLNAISAWTTAWDEWFGVDSGPKIVLPVVQATQRLVDLKMVDCEFRNHVSSTMVLGRHDVSFRARVNSISGVCDSLHRIQVTLKEAMDSNQVSNQKSSLWLAIFELLESDNMELDNVAKMIGALIEHSDEPVFLKALETPV